MLSAPRLLQPRRQSAGQAQARRFFPFSKRSATMQKKQKRTLSSAPAFLQKDRATARRGSRPRPARRFSAALRTSAMNLQPRGTAQTASTGVFCRSPLTRAQSLIMTTETMFLFPESVTPSKTAKRKFRQRSLQRTACMTSRSLSKVLPMRKSRSFLTAA